MKKLRVALLLIMLVVISVAMPLNAASKVNKVVKNAKSLYYGAEKKIKKKKLKVLNNGGCKDYYQGKRLIMTQVYKSNNLCSPKGCKAEFYYDKKYRPIFVFAWKKVNGKIREYRAYYGTNGKCYRYIGPDHKVHDYKNGRSREKMSPMESEMLSKAYQNLHLIGII